MVWEASVWEANVLQAYVWEALVTALVLFLPPLPVYVALAHQAHQVHQPLRCLSSLSSLLSWWIRSDPCRPFRWCCYHAALLMSASSTPCRTVTHPHHRLP